MKPCTFCEIIAFRLPADIVYENEAVVAFLDNRPLFPGHVLVVPRAHHVTMAGISTAELGPLMEVVRLFSLSMPRALGCQGSFLANNNKVSQSVPHLHWHVVPRTKGDGLKGFFWPRQPYASPEQLAEMAKSLRLTALQEEVLDFWFGPADATSEIADFYRERRIQPNAASDGEIRGRFKSLVDRDAGGKLEEWTQTERGVEALKLLREQLGPRMAERDGQTVALLPGSIL